MSTGRIKKTLWITNVIAEAESLDFDFPWSRRARLEKLGNKAASRVTA